MAEAFLSQLLVSENRVQSEENAQCPVCFQKYGTLTDTGATESEIRLPCNHTLGSMCAFKWLKSSNTCPFCRKELFAAPLHPRSEYDRTGTPMLITITLNDDDPHWQLYRRQCEGFCASLGLDSNATMVSCHLAAEFSSDPRLDTSLLSNAAAAIYMATRVEAIRRLSVEEISPVVGVPDNTIYACLRNIFNRSRFFEGVRHGYSFEFRLGNLAEVRLQR